MTDEEELGYEEHWGCLFSAAAVVCLITVALTYLAQGFGWAAGLFLFELVGGAVIAWWSLGGFDRLQWHPSEVSRLERSHEGVPIVRAEPIDRRTELFNLSDPACELCQDHPGVDAPGSLEPCVCTWDEGRRW